MSKGSLDRLNLEFIEMRSSQMPTNREIYLPPMGCGTWAWGNRLLWGYDAAMDRDLQQVFDLCVASGVTFFDTGDSYGTGKLKGRSEELLGTFANNYSGNNRENICLATKLAPYPWRLTRKSILAAAQASSHRLQRNIDLVQMHWSTGNYAPWQETAILDGLGDLYDRGLVKGVGLSNFGSKRLKKADRRLGDRGIPITTLQVQYSLLSTHPVTELGLKDVCDELGIKLIAYSPLCLGLLTGKYSANGNLPSGIRGFLFKRMLAGMGNLLGCLEAIAKERDRTISQVALNWCICKGTIPIPGAKSISQAQDNIGALGWHLDAGEIAELDTAAAKTEPKMVQNIFQSR